MTDETAKKPPQGLTITPATATLKPGETVQLTCSNPQASWSSANPAVATVTSAGFVTAMSAAGSTTIKAQYKGDKGSMSVTVVAAPIEPPIEPPAEPLTVTPTTAELYPGDSVQLTASKPGVNWASDNAHAATVNQSGLASGVAEGHATVSALVNSESGTMQITVRNRADVTPSPYGPYVISQPVGATVINQGSDIPSIVNAASNGTVFWVRSGVYALTTPINMKPAQQLVGEYGAILEGSGVAQGFDPSSKSIVRGWGASCADVAIKNLIIRNLPGFNGVGNYGTGTDRWLIDHNEISGCRWGVNIGGNTGGVVTNNFIHDNKDYVGDGSSGGYGSSLSFGIRVEHNRLSGNGAEQKFTQTDGSIWRNNLHENELNAIWFDGDNINVLIENNEVNDSAYMGVFYEISGNGVIRNNTIRRSGDNGIFLSGSRDVEVYGNTLVDNFRSVNLYVQCERVYSPGDPYPEAIGWDLRNNLVRDNTITVPNVASVLSNSLATNGGGCTTTYTNGSKNNHFTGNIYRVPNLSAAYWNWETAKTWAQWQALGNDTGGSISL